MVGNLKPLPSFETLKIQLRGTVFDMICDTFESCREEGDKIGTDAEIIAVNTMLSRNGSRANIFNTTTRLGYDPHELRDYIIARYTDDHNNIDYYTK